ncbi:MAG: Fe-S-cluster-containing hydrogenase component 2/CRP-like cAMP-binding protein [Planctomycetota bacterium]|jgi:Fe-S-cluster-containing hydrogenase component 2/CRP-like cAMP-binding protein
MSNIPPEVYELPLFAKLNPKQKKLLEAEAALDVCPAGEVFSRQGEYSERFCVILTGGASMYRKEDGETSLLGSFGQRDWFGELGALSSQPEPATLKADTNCTFIVCDQALFKQLYKNKHFKGQVDGTYRRISLSIHLRVAPLLRNLSLTQLRSLEGRLSMLEYDKGRVIAKEGDATDAVYLVRSGAISCRSNTTGKILGYYMSNSTFGENCLTAQGVWPGDYETMAVTSVLKIPVDVLRDVFAAEPEVLAELSARAGQILAEERGEVTGLYDRTGGPNSDELEVMVGKQSVKGGEALVINLDSCVRCNACVESCVAVHEDRIPRLSKTGNRVISKETGRPVMLATSCYNCDIPECMMACEYGAIRRDVQGLIRYVWDNCVGCQMCSTACPYGVISMTPPPAAGAAEPHFKRHWFLQTIPFIGKKFAGSHAKKCKSSEEQDVDPEAKATGALRGVESRGKAIKCDLCAGLPFEACVYNCPTQAIVRMNPERVLTGKDDRLLLPKH